jgi:hypothetical protein
MHSKHITIRPATTNTQVLRQHMPRKKKVGFAINIFQTTTPDVALNAHMNESELPTYSNPLEHTIEDAKMAFDVDVFHKMIPVLEIAYTFLFAFMNRTVSPCWFLETANDVETVLHFFWPTGCN